MNKVKNDKGFTLVEVLFAIAVGMLLLGAIYTVMVSGEKSSVTMERKVIAQQDARAALQIMALEIGMASYNSNFTASIWRNPGDCTSAAANQTYKGIPLAATNSITVEMDINENGSVGPPDGNEIIGYVYDTANQRITRETSCGGAQPFLGDDPASGRPRTVRVINDINGNGVYDDGTDIPIFRYYDGAGNLIPFASLPANIPNIRRIDITLAVETEEIDSNTGQRRRMIYSTSVVPRNHAMPQ